MVPNLTGTKKTIQHEKEAESFDEVRTEKTWPTAAQPTQNLKKGRIKKKTDLMWDSSRWWDGGRDAEIKGQRGAELQRGV